MKLGQKFLTLVTLVLLFVLGGSFFLIFSDLRTEFLRDFNSDLDKAAAVFEAQEETRFKTLGILGDFLEASPAFRNVLRRADYETLYEFLREIEVSADVSLIVVTNDQGRLLSRTDKHGRKDEDLSKEKVVSVAVEGGYLEGYWLFGEHFYQVVAIPMVDAQDFVDGVLILGHRIDQEFLGELTTEMGGQLAISWGGDWNLSTDDRLKKVETSGWLTRSLSLKAGESGSGIFLLARPLEPMEKFFRKSQLKLVSLGFCALFLALLVSTPLIGKMTNPVEQLEQAQAEMQAIFEANVDGLLATDEKGIVTTCNAAATVALGLDKESLIGDPLASHLPEEIKNKLLDGDLSKRVCYTRQGREFEVSRTFIRRQGSELLGSIFLFRDVTQSLQNESLFYDFLHSLERELQDSELSLASSLYLRNLVYWSELGQDSSEFQAEAVKLTQFKPFESSGNDQVMANQRALGLVLDNMVSLADSEADSLLVSKDGGAYRFQVSSKLPVTVTESELGKLEPLRTELGLAGLNLFVVNSLVARLGSRLRVASSENGGQAFDFHLPAAESAAKALDE